MGVQPTTLQSGLVAATASTDTTAPTSVISSPAAGATVPVGQSLTISGTASDAGGGRVAGVEVSLDGGASWHPANGRDSWSYTITPGSSGTLTLRTRATDDSARMENPGPGRTVTVGNGPPPPATCPCTIWPASATPAVAADPDNSAIEVGVKFRASQGGSITGIRFYKGTANTGTHVGSLWSATGTKLATATFTGESASGWQQVQFATPVAITAGTTYVASYSAPNGRYATTENYFGTATANGPLTALADGTSGANGVYTYGAGAFPTSGFRSSNYWVDVVFATTTAADTTKPTLTDRQPAPGATGVASLDAGHRHVQRAGHRVLGPVHPAGQRQRRRPRNSPRTTPQPSERPSPRARARRVGDVHRLRLRSHRPGRQHDGPGRLELHHRRRPAGRRRPRPPSPRRTPAAGATQRRRPRLRSRPPSPRRCSRPRS